MSQTTAENAGPGGSGAKRGLGGRGAVGGGNTGGGEAGLAEKRGPGSYLAPPALAARGCTAPRPRRTGRCGSSGCRRRGAPPRSLRAWGPSRGRAGETGGASVTALRRAQLRASGSTRWRGLRSRGQPAREGAGRTGRGRGAARQKPSAHAQLRTSLEKRAWVAGAAPGPWGC